MTPRGIRLALMCVVFLVTLQSVHAASIDLALDTFAHANNLTYAIVQKNNNVVHHVNQSDVNLSLQFELPVSDTVEAVVRIENLTGTSFNWAELNTVHIQPHQEFVVRNVFAAITLEGFSNFLNEEQYNALISFVGASHSTEHVQWCDTTCTTLPVCVGDTPCYTVDGTSVSVHVPHFSSVVLTQSTDPVTIMNPNNNSVLSSGEHIVAHVSSVGTVNFSYRLNNASFRNIPSVQNTTHSHATFILGHEFHHEILSNGAHTLEVQAGNTTVTHAFTVNDVRAPSVEVLSLQNGQALETDNTTMALAINCSEYAHTELTLNDALQQSFNLYRNETVVLSIPLETGSNTLTLAYQDVHNNSGTTQLTYTVERLGTCEDALQNGDETGVDCGGRCSACVPFSISVEKATYNTSEDVTLTIQARVGATVNYTVLRGSSVLYRDQITPYSPGFPIYYSTILGQTSTEATYYVYATMNYLSLTENKQTTFTVEAPVNPLSVTIDVSDSSINEGENITFTAEVTGAPDDVTYAWDINDDAEIDHTNRSFLHTYTTNGSYTVNLTVFSGGYNKSASTNIMVYRILNITTYVKDLNNKALPNASVLFDSTTRKTDALGKTSFLVRPGVYDVVVSKSGYTSTFNTTRVSQSGSFTYKLNDSGEDFAPPRIKLVSPANNSDVVGDTVTLSYIVTDDSTTTCELYTKTNITEWYTTDDRAVTSGVQVDIAYAANDGVTYWYVLCTDNNGYSSTSSTHIFRKSQSLKTTAIPDDPDVNVFIKEIDETLSAMQSWTGTEQTAKAELQLEETLRKAKMELSRAKRDLHNVKFRDVGEEEGKRIVAQLHQKIEDIKDNTIRNAKVVKGKEFVSYPTEEDILELASMYKDYEGNTFENETIDEALAYLKHYQEHMIVTTRWFTLDATMVSGQEKRITGIAKTITFENEDLLSSNSTILLQIPKEIAESVSDINFLNPVKVIKDDPVVQISKLVNNRIIFFVDGEYDDALMENIQEVLVPRSLADVRFSPVTGLSVFTRLQSYFVEANATQLAIQILIILVLIPVAGYYLVYPAGKPAKKKNSSKSTHSQTFQQVLNTAEHVTSCINNNLLHDAKEAYKTIHTLYKVLPSHEKSRALAHAHTVKGHIDAAYLKSLVQEAHRNVTSGKRSQAKATYQKVCTLYRTLPPEHKKEVHIACTELHKKL